MRKAHALVLSLTSAATLIAGGLIGVSTASAGTAGVDACTVTAYTPYANNGLVFVGGTNSACDGAPMDILMSWSIVGPDQTMHTKTGATKGVYYGWYCTWGSPQNRNIYTTAKMYAGPSDTSSIVSFTSAQSDCEL